MRKHLSVFMLYIRSSIFKILLLFLLMAAVELPMFYFAVEKSLALSSIGIERMFERSHIAVVLAAALVLMSAQLCSAGCEYGSKQGYTLRRLSVSERTVFAWQAAFNALAYLLLLGFQLMLVIVMCQYGVEKMGEWASNQSIFLAFYRNRFLHSLLPLEEWTRYLRNVFIIIALGMASALFSYNQRRKKPGLAIIITLPVVIFGFPASAGGTATDVIMMLYTATVAAWCVYKIRAKEESYDED